MLRNVRRIAPKKSYFCVYIPKNTFLTNDYKCNEAWNSQSSSTLLTKVNLNDFYNVLDQNYSSKGVISAIDVDIFANAIKDPIYLEELKDLLHKLRLSADTGSTLESTHHATVRHFIEFNHIPELVDILKDPLTFGLFLDHYTANILLDKLIQSENYDLAANVASLILLQEDFSNEITCALCQYASYMYIKQYKQRPQEPVAIEEKKKKVEELKIRIKYLRNPYFDDHFDIKDTYTLSGKALAWISEISADNLNNNLQVIGWLVYKKCDKLLLACEHLSNGASSKVFIETINLLKRECNGVDSEAKVTIDTCISKLNNMNLMEVPIEEAIKVTIENAINKNQGRDILQQQKLFNTWTKLREEKLEQQIKRLDRAKRMELIQEKQKKLKDEEQKLWFFENEDAIDLEIEEKEKLVDKSPGKKTVTKKSDENYIPPEIVRKST